MADDGGESEELAGTFFLDGGKRQPGCRSPKKRREDGGI